MEPYLVELRNARRTKGNQAISGLVWKCAS